MRIPMKLSASPLVMLFAAALTVPGWSEEERWEKAQKQYEENVRIAALHPVKELKKAIKDGQRFFLNSGFLPRRGWPINCRNRHL
jgi:hypothetical protein